jgi:inosose dehydratase
MSITRRGFVAGAAAVSLSALAPAADRTDAKLHVSTNQYPWLTFFGREKKDWNRDVDASLKEVAATGVSGFEPLASSTGQIEQLGPLLKKHGLEMRSLYVNSKLHDKDAAGESINRVLSIADAAAKLGCKVVVTNPEPIRWGGPEGKSDTQIRVQAENLDRLGGELRKRGLALAYHNHDAEMRFSAREFHHMMLGTDPENVRLCLDAHWVFRGSGDSQVCLFDVARLYGKRVVELHLRQSKGGVWTETLGPGDIDYPALVKLLAAANLKPLVVLEQAVEAKTPKTLDAVAAHKESLKYAREVFQPLAG